MSKQWTLVRYRDTVAGALRHPAQGLRPMVMHQQLVPYYLRALCCWVAHPEVRVLCASVDLGRRG